MRLKLSLCVAYGGHKTSLIVMSYSDGPANDTCDTGDCVCLVCAAEMPLD